MYPNHVWSYDFVSDRTSDGRTIKCMTVIDEFTREGLTIEVNRSMTSGDVLLAFQRLFFLHGRPACIKSDNGPEMVAKHLQRWLSEQHIDTKYIDPGSPWQNGHNESFNGIFRDGCLDRWEFYSLPESRRVIAQWLDEYNHERPHGALNDMTPVAFAETYRKQKRNAA
jgi:transposase InsO family protein